jgi:hypothetical protein
VTLPLPLPLAPAVIVSHDAFDVAVHAQPVREVTATELFVDEVAATFALVGEAEYVHATAACVTVKVCVPMVMRPVRLAVLVFAATA